MAKELSPIAKDILEGLNNALAHARGKPTPGTIEHVVWIPDVKAIRRSLRMTQEEFARTYKIPVATLRGWEQRRRHPDATVSAYLCVIDRYPKEVQQVLADESNRPKTIQGHPRKATEDSREIHDRGHLPERRPRTRSRARSGRA
jgi:putative transcriptional regulator